MDKVDTMYEQMETRDGNYEKQSSGNAGNKAMVSYLRNSFEGIIHTLDTAEESVNLKIRQ